MNNNNANGNREQEEVARQQQQQQAQETTREARLRQLRERAREHLRQYELEEEARIRDEAAGVVPEATMLDRILDKLSGGNFV